MTTAEPSPPRQDSALGSDVRAASSSPEGGSKVVERPVRARFEPSAQLLGWAMLALVNALFIARLSLPPGGKLLRLVHHAYDAGMMLFCGLVLSALCEAWQRWGPRRRFLGLGLITGASIVAGFFTLHDDLSGFAVDYGGSQSELLLTALVVAGALVVPAAAWLGSVLARPRLRWAGAGLGFAVALINQLILPKGYSGIHLYLAFTGATLFGTSLATGEAWSALERTSQRTSRLLLAGRAALSIATTLSVIVLPRQAALVELYRLDGQVVAPVVGALHTELSSTDDIETGDAGEWFENRENKPPVPPTNALSLPKDGIVILITVDSLMARVIRDDDNRSKLPVLFSMRDSGVDFTEARAPASGTTTTISSLMTCKYVSQLKWSQSPGIKRATPYKDDSIRLAQALERKQVQSTHVVSYSPLRARSGIGLGFGEEQLLSAPQGHKTALSDTAIPALIKALKKQRKRGRLFLYAHLMDPHHPHDLGSQEGELFDRYVSEVAVLDAQLGRLQQALHDLGLAERTVLIVTADHGEGFGMHDTPHHNINLYEELIHVPLLITGPGISARRIREPVTLLDLPPTILDLFGLPTPGAFMGQSLAPVLAGKPVKLTRPIASEIPAKRAMFFGRMKLIHDHKKGTVELYDLDKDPLEADNLYDQNDAAHREKFALLKRFFGVHKQKAGAPPAQLD